MQLPKEKYEQVKMIFDKLGDNKLSGWLYDLISGWLVSGDSAEEKENQLAQKFDREFRCSARPSRQAFRSFQTFAKRNGLPSTTPRIPIHKRWTFRIAAVLIPALVIGTGLFWQRNAGQTPDPMTTTVTVAATLGESEVITLPDHSVVTLEPGSELRTAESFDGNRYVELSGQAHFNVTEAKTESDTFRIKTAHFDIAVLGTEFRVDSRLDRDNGEISLYHGGIRVAVADEKITLAAGDQLHYNTRSGAVEVTRIKLSERVYDNLGKLPKECTLNELFRILENEYRIPVQTQGELPEVEVRMDFSKVRTIQGLLNILEKMSDQFTYELTDTEIIIKIRNR